MKIPTIPATVSKRLIREIPKFKKILNEAEKRDIKEPDTVSIIIDILTGVFGFDKYSEITREYAINTTKKKTYCDIAVKIEGKIEYLIEAKAIGHDLNEKNLKQAVGYAANEGIQWVVLTNGIKWEVYEVTLDKKVNHQKLFTINFLEINPKEKKDQQDLFMLCKRGVSKKLIKEYSEYKKTVNPYTIGALLLTEPMLKAMTTNFRKLKGGRKVHIKEMEDIIKNEIIKSYILEGEQSIDPQKLEKEINSKRSQ